MFDEPAREHGGSALLLRREIFRLSPNYFKETAEDAHALPPSESASSLRVRPVRAGFLDPSILPAYERASSALVSISLADRAPELTYVGNVYHGVEPKGLPFKPADRVRRPS